jgi:Tol biopolymer transport system component
MKQIAIVLTLLAAGLWSYFQLSSDSSLSAEAVEADEAQAANRRLLKLPSDAETRQISVTPDGQHVTIGAGPGQDRARMLDVRTGGVYQIPFEAREGSSGARFTSAPLVSSDGAWIAYMVGRVGESPNRVEIKRRDGSGSRTLYSGPWSSVFPRSWSPEGDRIAVFYFHDGDGGLAVLDVNSGEVDALEAAATGRTRGPFFSPDGRFLAYSAAAQSDEAEPPGEVYVQAAGGGGEHQITHDPSNDRLIGWTPSGDALLFLSDRRGTDDVWAAAIRDGAPVGAPVLVVPELRNGGPMGMTVDGDLVYQVRVGEPATYAGHLDEPGGAAVRETTRLSDGWYAASWSPDGQYLVSERWGRQLIIQAAATGAEREVPVSGYDFGRPGWAPDGSALLVQTWDTRANRQFSGLIDVGTGEVTDLGTFGASATLGADMTTVYFARGGDVVAHDRETAQERTVFQAPQGRPYIQGITLSRTGDRIAVAHAPGGVFPGLSNTVTVVGSDGNPSEILKLDPGEYLRQVRWAPDGRSLYFLKSGGSGSDGDLWRVPVSGGAAERVHLPVEAPPISALGDFHPDGDRFTYASRGIREVWIMEGVAEAAHRAIDESR